MPIAAGPGSTSVHVVHSYFGRAHVDLVGPPAAVDEIVARGAPWLAASPVPVGSRVATIHIGRDHAPDGDWRPIERQPLPFEPASRLLLDDAGHRVVIDQDDPDWLVLQTMRVLRSSLKYAVFGPELMFMHGACITINGATILISGRSRSGKTSTMLTALSHAGSAYLSNDDVTITLVDGELVASGWPRSVCVRRDSFDGFRRSGLDLPEDRLQLEQLEHPSNRWQRNWTDHESIWLFPGEVATLFGGEMQLTARPDAVVFPGFDDDCETTSVLERLDAEAALAMTEANREAEASTFDLFLRDWVPTEGSLADDVMRRVAALPCFRLRQSMGSLASSRNLLAEIARAPSSA